MINEYSNMLSEKERIKYEDATDKVRRDFVAD
jgi:hypothetical protein